MPRNSSGTYSLPAGNPVVTNTLIQSTWANSTMSDVGTAMTDSLDRNGRGAMLAPLKNVDGTAVAPSITFSSEGTLGAYRVSAGILGIAVGGALVLSISSTGLSFTTPLVLPLGTAAAPSLTFTGNTNTGLYSPATNQVGLTTNGVQRVLWDATGNQTLATGTLTFTAGQQLTFAATGANLITASHAAGTLALQTGGANTRLSIDAAGLVTVAGNTGIGGAPALGRLQVFGGAVVIDNAQAYAAKSSGGTATNVVGLDSSNNLLIGSGAAVATQQFATGGNLRVTIDATGNVGFRVTPSAWSTLTAIEGSSGAIAFNGTASIYAAQNIAFSGGAWLYKTTAAASLYSQSAGVHQWQYAASGTAGNPATLATGMSFDGNGALALNVANPNNRELMIGGRANVELALKSNVASGGAGASTLYFGNSSTDGVGFINYDHSGNALSVSVNSGTRLTISSAGVIADSSGNELGWKDIPGIANTFTRGACNVITAGTTINTAVANNVFSLYNNSAAAVTLTQGAGLTLRQGGTTNTGNRTLLPRGFCTVWYFGSGEAVINGNIT